MTCGETIGDEYPRQQARIRMLIGYYREIGPAGNFGAAMLEATLREADAAMASGDIVRVLRALATMKECK